MVINGDEGTGIFTIVTDNASGGCTATISAITPRTCSRDCLITITEVGTVTCEGDDTNTPDDDRFYFTINVTGVNVGGNGWEAEEPFGNVYTGDYGVQSSNNVTVGPYSWIQYAGQTIEFTITDVENPDCGFGQIDLDVPEEACSPDCSLILSLVAITCDDNQTPADPSDDLFYAWVDISGDNISFDGWTDDIGAPNDAGEVLYGLYEFGPYQISGGDHMLTIMDQIYPDCEVSINLPAPAPCSDECELTVIAEPTVCDDNDTATPEDDTYTAVITVMPEGDCSILQDGVLSLATASL